MRRLWLVLGGALVFASSGAAASPALDRGLVIKVRPPHLAIRELDGTRMRFAINGATLVVLDGRRVRLARLRRGDVAEVRHEGQFVIAIRAFRP